jgi:hypothetical protein
MSIFNGMRITRASGDGRMPWSPTVVNIQRMKTRRRKRTYIIIALVTMLLLCGICGCSFKAFYKPKAAQVQSPPPVAATVAPVQTRIVPAPACTPLPGNPLVCIRVEPLK